MTGLRSSLHPSVPGAGLARMSPAIAGGRLVRCLAAVGLGLLLVACQTTETSRSTQGTVASQPPPGRNVAPPPSGSSGSASDETRRRAGIRLELSANHFQQGNHSQALQDAEEAVRIDPGFAQGYGMLGLIHLRLGDRARADENFQRALRLEPKDAELNNNYGWYLCQTGRQREALQYFNNALEDRLYATPSRPLHNAGICLLQIGDDAAAESYLLRSHQADPGGPVAMFNLGQLYLKRRNFERARYFSDRLMSAYQPTAETLWLAVRVARLSGDNDNAARIGSQLRSRFPDSREARLLQRGAFGE